MLEPARTFDLIRKNLQQSLRFSVYQKFDFLKT